MKFKIIVRKLNDNSEWTEEYDEDVEDAEQWSKDIINRFNATLHPGESPRELLLVVIFDTKNKGKPRGVPVLHGWDKTNLVTVEDKNGRMCDTYKCTECGITGKIYRLGGDVERDAKFRYKIYGCCKEAKIKREKSGDSNLGID